MAEKAGANEGEGEKQSTNTEGLPLFEFADQLKREKLAARQAVVSRSHALNGPDLAEAYAEADEGSVEKEVFKREVWRRTKALFANLVKPRLEDYLRRIPKKASKSSARSLLQRARSRSEVNLERLSLPDFFHDSNKRELPMMVGQFDGYTSHTDYFWDRVRFNDAREEGGTLKFSISGSWGGRNKMIVQVYEQALLAALNQAPFEAVASSGGFGWDAQLSISIADLPPVSGAVREGVRAQVSDQTG